MDNALELAGIRRSILLSKIHSKTGAHQHHVPSTANNNENLTNDESSNQEGSDSQEIVELEWSNIISFVCDLQLFEKSYLLIHVFLKRKCYDELFSIFLRTKCDEKRYLPIIENKMLWQEFTVYIIFEQNIVVTVRLYCCLYKITCYMGYFLSFL